MAGSGNDFPAWVSLLEEAEQASASVDDDDFCAQLREKLGRYGRKAYLTPWQERNLERIARGEPHGWDV